MSALAAEAGQLVQDGAWEVAPEDAELACRAAEDLAAAVGPPARQQELSGLERLEHLREALAVLALTTARTHGYLAWFLAGTSTALVPVLRWRALTAEPGRSFGTVLPSAAELTDAEEAVRHLRSALAGIAGMADGGNTAAARNPDPLP
ncbi:hypothetical protein [Streptomyces sp. enrichment culture]|uniref:hypothetical protein n=1 Tax=Streptomyces sp. enrichment culture TaxID=1795815 RepID=UPI001995B14D|nr:MULTISPECIES: hypothetical protein [Streptomyces]GGS91676.1 hypothetical protein GCM10010286_15500 [Streptomyces toxytricini]